jgi:hypothetical protein
MKMTLLLLLALALGSCILSSCILSSCGHVPNTTIPRDALGRPQPIEVDTLAPIIPDACRDSLFLALQTKPVSQMTAYEKAYFQQKWDECNGTPAHSGSTPEWIMATLDILAAVAVFIQLTVW